MFVPCVVVPRDLVIPFCQAINKIKQDHESCICGFEYLSGNGHAFASLCVVYCVL